MPYLRLTWPELPAPRRIDVALQPTDALVELSDWSMPVRTQRRIARALTPLLPTLFRVPPADMNGINICFHSYPPSDFAVGGRLLTDVMPRIGQVMKRLAG